MIVVGRLRDAFHEIVPTSGSMVFQIFSFFFLFIFASYRGSITLVLRPHYADVRAIIERGRTENINFVPIL